MPPITIYFLAYVGGLLCGFTGWTPYALVLAAVAALLGRPSRLIAALASGIAILGTTTANDARAADVSCRRRIVAQGNAHVRLTSELSPARSATGFAGPGCRVAVFISARASVPQGALVAVRGDFARSGGALSVRDATVDVLSPPGVLARTRTWLGRYLDALYGADAPLAKALTIADQREIPREVKDRFADSGIVHMLSVSGLHVSIIAGSLLSLFVLSGLAQRAAVVASLVFTAAYVVLIGAPPPAVRSAGMCALAGCSRLLQRPTSGWAVWAAGSSLSLVEPRVAVDLGWQLSVGGMAGLLASGELIKRLALPFSGWRAALANNVVATAVASIASAPLVAWQFGRVSVAAVITNLAAAPLFNIVQPLLFASILTGPVRPVAEFLADAARGGLWLVDRVAIVGAAVPGAVLRASPDAPTAILLGVVATALLVACQARNVRRPLGIALVAATAAAWLPAVMPGPGVLQIFMIDVGQGDAIAVRSPRGRWLLIDAGGGWRTGDAAERMILPLVRRRGGDIVHLVLTHPHLDHIGGARRLLAAGVDTMWDAGFVEPSREYGDVLREARTRGVSWQRADAGHRFTLDGATIHVLSPDPEWLARQDNPNEASVVVQIEFGQARLLFMGDAESGQEGHLVDRYGGQLASHVLKVGHHGSQTSTTPSFLQAVAPRLALVSVGTGNRYGHPSLEVLRALDAADADVLRTDDVGTIMLRTNGRSIEVLADGYQWRYSTER